MAQRRMLSLKVIDTDMFLEMPQSTRLLYFDLNMRADDDGFVSCPKKIIKITNASEDDFKILCAKKYIIPFQSGVCVIKHWHIHNLIRHDRYNETEYIVEKDQIEKINNKYELKNGCQNVIPDVNQMATQDRLGKGRLVKDKDIMSCMENEEIINYLNLKANTGFKSNSKKTIDLIRARLNEGWVVEDFKRVIDNKCSQWLKDNKMCMYLRPETLFGTKFESYLNEKINGVVNSKYTDEDFKIAGV